MSLPSLPRVLSLFRKEVTESVRDWKMWSMTLSFAPFFVLLMYAYLGHSTPSFQIAVVNLDQGAVAGAGEVTRSGADLILALGAVFGTKM